MQEYSLPVQPQHQYITDHEFEPLGPRTHLETAAAYYAKIVHVWIGFCSHLPDR